MQQFSVQIDSNLTLVLRKMRILRVEIQRASRSGLRQGLALIRGGIQETIRDTFRHKSAGGLMQSVRANVFEEGDELSGLLVVDKKYAGIHEFGGTIRPREKKALTVPIAPEAVGRRAADFPNLIFIKRGAGKPPILAIELFKQTKVRQIATDPRTHRKLFGVRQGAAGTARAIKPLFILLKSVDMPARPYFFPTIKERLQEIPKAIRQQIDAALKGPAPAALLFAICYLSLP